MGAEIDRFPARVVPALRARDAGDSYTSTVAGLRFVLTLLSKADQELKSSGVISADTLKRLEKYLGAELVKDITPLNHGLWNSRDKPTTPR